MLKCIDYFNEITIGPASSISLIIISCLPHFMHNFESPSLLCLNISNQIALVTFYLIIILF